MTSSERIGLLMFRYGRKELSDVEEKELSAWRNTHPDNEAFFLSTTDPEHIRLGIKDMYDTKDIVYDQLRERFPGYFPDPPVIIKKIPWVYRVLSYAVALWFGWLAIFTQTPVLTEDLLAGTNQAGMLFGEGTGISFSDWNRGFLTGYANITLEPNGKGDYIYHANSNEGANAKTYYRLFTAPNGQLDLRLPDGTRIFLNGNSTVRYPRKLSQDSLKIFIEGEAWLELPKTSHHTTIFLNNTKLEAVDAQLDAEVYKGDSVKRITMLRGSAMVFFGPEGRLKQDSFQLDANQELTSSAGKINIQEASDTSETISWKNGRIHFTNANIQTIMRTIEHGYGVKVEYKGKITDQKFSLDVPRKTTLGDVLTILKLQGLNYSIKKNTIIIQ